MFAARKLALMVVLGAVASIGAVASTAAPLVCNKSDPQATVKFVCKKLGSKQTVGKTKQNETSYSLVNPSQHSGT